MFKNDDEHVQDFIERDVTIDERYIARKVLLDGGDGQMFFKWLILNLGLYRPVMNERDLYLQQFAFKLLHVLGIYKRDALEESIDYFKVIAEKDVLHPQTRHSIEELLHGRRTES